MKYEHVYGQERKRMRWATFDYSSQAVYFVTVVTKNRTCLFGDVVDGEMLLNDAGRMIQEQYLHLEQSMDGLECMDFVVMPNHFHALVDINKESIIDLPLVMKNFKGITTNLYSKGVKDYGWSRYDGTLWQKGYWDDIVWNRRMFEFIQHYIYLNPSRWNRDRVNVNHDPETDDIRGALDKLRMI